MAKVSATVRGWISKANDDFIGAQSLWETGHPRVLLLVGFHCQQSVEKSLKGFLLYHGKKVLKLHSIEELSKEVLLIAPEIQSLLAQAAELTPFAVQFRYPDAAAKEVGKPDVERALKLARAVLDEICRRIPFEAGFEV